MKEKYGADDHNLQDLFMKGDRIQHLGGKFLVVPSSTDFSIETIHCQTKLMGEYTRVYGEDGFKMADGTQEITKYNMTIVFWMVIDCLLKSKFVGYSANFTINSDVIIDGADVFFQHVASSSFLDVDSNKFLVGVGGIPGYFDPFVENEIDLDADAIPASKILSDNTVLHSLSCKSPFALDIVTSSSSKTAFMTDKGPQLPNILVGLIFWIAIILHYKYLLLGMAFPIQSNFNPMCMIF